MSPDGAKVWFIPDGYLATPVDHEPGYKNHEAFCVMNTTEQHAHLLIDFYCADRDPVEGVSVTVPAKRCLHLREGFGMWTRLYGNAVFLLQTHHFWHTHAYSSTLCSPVRASTWSVSRRPSAMAVRIMWMTSK